MMTREQLNALRAGDEVAWQSTNGTWYLTAVKGVSSTSITTTDGERWSKKYGKRYGSGSNTYRIYLCEATDERRKVANDRKEREALDRKILAALRRMEKLDLPTLRRVGAALDGPLLSAEEVQHIERALEELCHSGLTSYEHDLITKLRKQVEA